MFFSELKVKIVLYNLEKKCIMLDKICTWVVFSTDSLAARLNTTM